MRPALSYPQFARYAPTLGQALASWPKPITIDPAPLSPQTFAARLRDARRAKLLYCHKHECISERLWNAHGKDLHVTIESDGIRLGPRKAKDVTPVGNAKEPDLIEFNFVLGENLDDLCLCLPMMKPRPKFLIKNVSDEHIEKLETFYDVALLPHPTKKGKMILS